jgi:hypothetical protein
MLDSDSCNSSSLRNAMSHDSDAIQIACRFAEEALDIQRHVTFLQRKRTVDVYEIDRINTVLNDNRIECLPERTFLGIPPHHLNQSELMEQSASIRKIKPAISRLIHNLFDEMKKLTPFNADNEWYGSSLFTEWVEYFLPLLADDSTQDDISSLRSQAEQRSSDVHDDAGSDLTEEEKAELEAEKTEMIGVALCKAQYCRLRDRTNSLSEVLDRFEEIELIATTGESSALTGTYRQGFITLMATFDATVFDLVRAGLQLKFFERITALMSDKHPLKDYVKKGSWQAIQDNIIEAELKTQTLRDLLKVLNQWNVKCVPPDRKFVQLMEVVNRRNVHLHSRGVVDQKYVDGGENIYNLKIGAVAVIDEAYWQQANELCEFCVRQTASWVCSTP